MKKSIITLLSTAFLIVLSSNIQAQKIKLAHVNTAEIMQQLIARDSVEIKLAQVQKEMQGDLQKRQAKLTADYQEYLGKKDSLSKIMLQMTEESLRKDQQQLEVLPQQYEQVFQDTQNKLLEPLKLQLEAAIQKISKTQAFTYVFDASTVLYSKGGTDISSTVRQELNLSAVSANAPAIAPGK